MKKILAGLLFCGFWANIHAQDKLDTLVNQFCNCLNEKVSENEKSTKKTKLNLTEVAVVCMAPVFVENLSLLKEYYGEDFEINEKNGEMIGREIGMRAAVSCPGFMKLVMESEELKDRIDNNNKFCIETVSKTVTIKSVRETPSFTIVVRDEQGKDETLTVIRNGDGIGDFVANFKQYLTSTITVKYMVSEIYNPATKEFEVKKEIVSIKYNTGDEEED